ncbi:HIT family protein [soil metagenome]
MASIFTRIVNGEIPAYKVAENEQFLAFLDVNPLKAGHTLVIPKQEVDYIFALDNETYQGLWAFAKRVSGALEKAVPCKRIGVAVIGLEVPHAHIHLVPLDNIGDLDFGSHRAKFSQEEYKELAAKIIAQFK